jgi:hypothetical protein
MNAALGQELIAQRVSRALKRRLGACPKPVEWLACEMGWSRSTADKVYHGQRAPTLEQALALDACWVGFLDEVREREMAEDVQELMRLTEQLRERLEKWK